MNNNTVIQPIAQRPTKAKIIGTIEVELMELKRLLGSKVKCIVVPLISYYTSIIAKSPYRVNQLS